MANIAKSVVIGVDERNSENHKVDWQNSESWVCYLLTTWWPSQFFKPNTWSKIWLLLLATCQEIVHFEWHGKFRQLLRWKFIYSAGRYYAVSRKNFCSQLWTLCPILTCQGKCAYDTVMSWWLWVEPPTFQLDLELFPKQRTHVWFYNSINLWLNRPVT